MKRSSSPSGEAAYTSKETPYETKVSQDDIISPNLADQPDKPTKTESLLYSPLQASEIRLVSIQRARPDGVLRCNLVHAPLTKDLEFHALSYTWGDLNHKQTIMVNDQPLEVNQNLYGFLDQVWKMTDLSTRGEEILVEPSVDDLFRRECLSIYGEEISLAPFTEALHWWIDAMCINQRDDHEKNEQVPRMGQLYSSASQVWVWLGSPQPPFFDGFGLETLQLALDKGFTKQLSFANELDGKPAVLASQFNKAVLDIYVRILARGFLERMRGDSRTSDSPSLTNLVLPEFQVIVEAIKAGASENEIREGVGYPAISGKDHTLPIIPEDSDGFFGELMTLLDRLVTNPWFERTWIIQEFVLSRNPPLALIGNYPFRFSYLFDLSRSIFRNSSTMSNVAHVRFRMIEDKLSKISSLEGAYLTKRESGSSFGFREFSRFSPAHKLFYLLRLFPDKQSTIPHDHVYGMLGLLDDQLPEYLKPDYKLPFERVCQDYGRFIIEATQNLKIIEARKSELEACPSWIPDFRYLTDMHEYDVVSTTGAVRFSADGQQLTVEGIPIGRVLSCSCNYQSTSESVFDHLDVINDVILMGSARLTQRPIEAVFTVWFETMLDGKFIIPLDSVSNIQTMESLISDFTTAFEKLDSCPEIRPRRQNMLDDSLASIEVSQVVRFLTSSEYCLLETGDIAICRPKKSEPQTRHHEGDAAWALKGCEKLSILRPEEGGYTYAGHCQVLQPGILRSGWGSSYRLDEEFFAGKQLEEVTLV
jgi:hypothetical protein